MYACNGNIETAGGEKGEERQGGRERVSKQDRVSAGGRDK